jgi:hypothetical protein
MNITKEQLPVQQFERLGIQKERMDKWPKDEMKNLLSGFPSNMKFLTFRDNEGNTQKINAKLSVYQSTDGTVGLKVHPYRERIKNDMDLSKKEIELLKSGSTVSKTFNKQEYLIQLDQSVNELRRIRADHIKVAEAVGGSKMSPQQKTDLLTGQAVYLKNTEGSTTKISLDLSQSSGMRMESAKAKQDAKPVHEELGHTKEAKQQESYRIKR